MQSVLVVPGARVLVGGGSVARIEANTQVSQDLEHGELVSLPIAALVLVLIFGGIAAAGIPLSAAVVSISGSLLFLLGFTYLFDLDPNVVSVVTVMGLGLAIDYGLLMVSRYREELRRGLDSDAALTVMMTTAARAILFSALTVAASLCGLFAFDDPTYRSMGAGGVSVVLIALVAALTLVPAVLSVRRPRWLPARTRKPSSFIARTSAPPPEQGFFSAVTRRSQRHPVVVVVALVLLLATTALPFLHARFQNGARLVAQAVRRAAGQRSTEHPVPRPPHRPDPGGGPGRRDRPAGGRLRRPSARPAGDRQRGDPHGQRQPELHQRLPGRQRADPPPGTWYGTCGRTAPCSRARSPGRWPSWSTSSTR